MKIVSVGDGIFDDAVADVAGKPCMLLVADSREELMAIMQTVSMVKPVTVVRVAPTGRLDSDG